jgi:hypothetical protein
MSKGTGICDTGRHLVGLESPTYSNGSFRRVNSEQRPVKARGSLSILSSPDLRISFYEEKNFVSLCLRGS